MYLIIDSTSNIGLGYFYNDKVKIIMEEIFRRTNHLEIKIIKTSYEDFKKAMQGVVIKTEKELDDTKYMLNLLDCGWLEESTNKIPFIAKIGYGIRFSVSIYNYFIKRFEELITTD